MIQRLDFPSAGSPLPAPGCPPEPHGVAPGARRRPSRRAVLPARRAVTGRRARRTGVSRPGVRMWGVPEAVIFDFYGTLAHWADTDASSYERGVRLLRLRARRPPCSTATSRSTTASTTPSTRSARTPTRRWVRFRLGELSRACGVAPPMTGTPSSTPCASSTGARWSPIPRRPTRCARCGEAGVAIGVCSNWGWELDAYLDQVGPVGPGRLAHHLGTGRVTQTASRHLRLLDRGARHRPEQAVFVGDSWEPDVRGPRRLGMTAVHVWRAEERDGQERAAPSNPATTASTS